MDIEKEIFDEAQDALPEEFLHMSVDAINQRARLLENEIRVLKDESTRLNLEQNNMKEKIKENKEKIKLNNQLPYLVGNIVEVLEHSPEDEEEEDGAAADVDAQRKGKCVVLKTSTRQTIFLPVVGLVDADTLKPGDLVGVNKDSYLVLDTLPAEYDSRVKAMEVDEKPTEDYSDIGGLDKQIQELVEAIVLPIKHKDRFIKLGIKPPKGVLMYGPPGTGKTLMARAVAAQTNATFLKLAGPQLVQMFIGDGAKMVRDAFALAKEKSPCIIFIDEIDAIGTKRFDSELSGDREVGGPPGWAGPRWAPGWPGSTCRRALLGRPAGCRAPPASGGGGGRGGLGAAAKLLGRAGGGGRGARGEVLCAPGVWRRSWQWPVLGRAGGVPPQPCQQGRWWHAWLGRCAGLACARACAAGAAPSSACRSHSLPGAAATAVLPPPLLRRGPAHALQQQPSAPLPCPAFVRAGAAHHARAAQPAGRLQQQRRHQNHRSHQQVRGVAPASAQRAAARCPCRTWPAACGAAQQPASRQGRRGRPRSFSTPTTPPQPWPPFGPRCSSHGTAQRARARRSSPPPPPPPAAHAPALPTPQRRRRPPTPPPAAGQTSWTRH
jgi:ATP-dependent 26S proteasome regulatory subunit